MGSHDEHVLVQTLGVQTKTNFYQFFTNLQKQREDGRQKREDRILLSIFRRLTLKAPGGVLYDTKRKFLTPFAVTWCNTL